MGLIQWHEWRLMASLPVNAYHVRACMGHIEPWCHYPPLRHSVCARFNAWRAQ